MTRDGPRADAGAILARHGDLDVIGGPDWSDADLLVEVARTHSLAGNTAKVEAFLLRCAQLRPRRSALYLAQIGWHFQKAKRWARAITWYDRALETFPDYHLCLFRKGYCAERLHRPREAVAALEAAVAAFEASPPRQRERSAGIHAQVLFHLSRNLREIGDTGRALEMLRACADLETGPQAVVKREHLLASEAATMLADGQAERAIELLEEARVEDPGSPVILERLGIALAQAGRPEEAEAVLQRACGLPKGAVALLSLGRLKLARHDLAGAAASFAAALERHPQGEVQIRLELATLHERLGRPATARDILLRLANGRVPDHSRLAVAVQMRLAELLSANGHHGEAARRAAEATRHDPGDIAVADRARELGAATRPDDPPELVDAPLLPGFEMLAENGTSRDSGHVSTWFPERGFGFISPTDGRPTVFFHVTQLRAEAGDDLRVGRRVSFVVTTNHRTGRSQAEDVALESEAPDVGATLPQAD